MWRLLDKVYVLPSIAGKRKWVDYVPVKIGVYTGRADSFDDSGSVSAQVLTSTTGLIEWEDYTPVYGVTDPAAGKWRTDDLGWIPVTNTAGGGGSSILLNDGTSILLNDGTSILLNV